MNGLRQFSNFLLSGSGYTLKIIEEKKVIENPQQLLLMGLYLSRFTSINILN